MSFSCSNVLDPEFTLYEVLGGRKPAHGCLLVGVLLDWTVRIPHIPLSSWASVPRPCVERGEGDRALSQCSITGIQQGWHTETDILLAWPRQEDHRPPK